MNKLIFGFVWVLLLLSVVSAGSAIFVQHNEPDFNKYYQAEGRLNTYYPILSERDQCEAREDLIIQVSPGGCQPAVVRSDILAEQNVPVFCQLDAIKLNPLINVERIKNIRFSLAERTEGVVGVGFHPSRAALRTNDILLGSPIEGDIGYAVIVLDRNSDEESLPDSVSVDLRARVDYDAENVFGVGTSEFLLTPVSDVKWEEDKSRQSFLNGEYFLRLRDIEANRVSVDIYRGDDRINNVVVDKGQSQEIYLPGSYCRFGIKVYFDNFVSANPLAKLNVDGDIVDVYTGSRFLNNKCVVKDISYEGIGTGKARIICGNSEFELELKPMNYEVGDKVKFIPGTGEYTQEQLNDVYSIKEFTEGRARLDDEQIVNVSALRIADESKLYEAEYNKEIEEYFDSAISDYLEIVDEYPYAVSTEVNKGYYGEKALDKAISLASYLNKKRTHLSLLEKYKENYPDSYGKFEQDYTHLFLSDSSNAVSAIDIDSKVKTIRLMDIYEADKKSKANFNLGNRRIELEEGQAYEFSYGDNRGGISLEDVTADTARVSYKCTDQEGNKIQRVTLKQVINDENDRDSITVCDNRVLKLTGIQLEEFAKIRIEPTVKAGGETNLTVNIGIEKRAFALTPEKAQEKIDNLEETIKRWEGVRDGLGDFVKGMKAACFATSGVLTIKNFFSGLGGGAVARQRVMSGKGGWTERCEAEARKDGITVDACFNRHSNEISREVDLMKGIINRQDDVLEGLSDNYSSDQGFLLDKWVDSNAVANKYIEDELRNKRYGFVNVGDENIKIESLLVKNGGGDSYLSPNEARDLKFWLEVRKDSGLETRANNELKTLVSTINDRIKLDNKAQSDSGLLAGIGLGEFGVESKTGSVAVWTGGYAGVSGDKLVKGSDSRVQAVEYNGNVYFVTLQDTGGKLYVKDVYDGGYQNVTNSEIVSKVKKEYSQFEKSDELLKPVRIKEAKVQYFSSEPYKDTPAIVPFDVQGGWYAAIRQTLPAFKNIKAFESSGRVASFWLCHVGNDGEIDFNQGDLGDDKCGQFNANTGQSIDSFYGLSAEQTRNKVNQAISALNEAARARGKTGEFVNILGNQIEVGGPAIDSSGVQCQDFMSPEDCQLLFNVCDPVICPTSRCDFGGKYPVDDVVQSGIVGSALLCLPNSVALGGDVAVPVCLTGIHAGIDSYVSILEQHRACLQENIESGEYVGICDEIYSVYSCEFFWRQAAPLAKVLLPKAVELVYTGGRGQVRGGGEYMTVQNAWANTEASIDYFTNYYAGNSFDAFRARSIEESGSEVCKNFVSTKAPTDFETLIEPDSPPQFHAFFSEIPYSDATVPATGQYKVFYHIFSGNDRGVAYNVYLKDPPESSFYRSTPRINVASSYVNRGESVSETKDFTAPTGYKQLCVNINGEEECGFRQVSTSFAVNYISDAIVSDELDRTDISSESECISGGTNPAAILNPNLGEAAQEAIDPAVYNRGIVRVCATDNPGASTDPQRFVDVGNCGNQRITCWLDRESINNAISENNKGILNETITKIDEIARDSIVESGDYLIGDTAKQVINEITQHSNINSDGSWNEDKRSAESLISRLDVVLSQMYVSTDIAKVLLERGRLYDALARKFFKLKAKPNGEDNDQGQSDTDSSAGSSGNEQTGISGNNGGGGNGQEIKYTLAEDYPSNEKIDILFDGKPTGLYLMGDKLMFHREIMFMGLHWGWREENVGNYDPDKGVAEITSSGQKLLKDKGVDEGIIDYLGKFRVDDRNIISTNDAARKEQLAEETPAGSSGNEQTGISGNNGGGGNGQETDTSNDGVDDGQEKTIEDYNIIYKDNKDEIYLGDIYTGIYFENRIGEAISVLVGEYQPKVVGTVLSEDTNFGNLLRGDVWIFSSTNLYNSVIKNSLEAIDNEPYVNLLSNPGDYKNSPYEVKRNRDYFLIFDSTSSTDMIIRDNKFFERDILFDDEIGTFKNSIIEINLQKCKESHPKKEIYCTELNNAKVLGNLIFLKKGRNAGTRIRT